MLFLHRDVSYVPNFFEALGHVHRRELIEVLGFDPSRITLEQLEEAFDVVEAICADESLRDELKRFCDDSDVKQICASFGVNHDPHSTYKLLIIDNEAATASGQMTSFIPTYDKLGALAKSEMTGTNPAHIDAVMTESYSKTYAGHVADAKIEGVDLSDVDELNDFATLKGLSANDKNLLITRQEINKKYGANEHFLGNGLTKDNNAPVGQVRYGTVETFTQDKNPQTLGQLKQNGVIKIVDLN